jgi:hypothetical protein
VTMTWTPAVMKFANAIRIAEGSPIEWNNPGSLTGADRGAFPVTGTANKEGVWKFMYASDGYNALCVKVERILCGLSHVYPLTMTLAEVGLKYSGGNPAWAENVAKELGVPVTMTLAEWVAANP